ncbi:MAG: hypothetical protein ACLSHG_07015 [Oscillospiraceae bacterium]
MHELALCDAMLKMVRDISREQALEGVRSITVRVGSPRRCPALSHRLLGRRDRRHGV